MSEKSSETLSYDEIRAMFAASARRHEELDRFLKKTAEESAKRHKKLDELVGGMGNNIGYHTEQFFQDAFAASLTFGGEKYDEMYPNIKKIVKNAGVELDILLINGKSAAIIETKNRIHPNDVKKLAEEKIVTFRKLFPIYKNHKVYLGLAGFSFCETVPEQAREYGIGIIRQIGETVEVEAGHLKAY